MRAEGHTPNEYLREIRAAGTTAPLIMLNRLEELGRAERTGVGQVMPSLRVRDFNFASLSDAV